MLQNSLLVKVSKFLVIVCCFFMLSTNLWAQNGMTIPTTHPRLWWNAQRLAQAQTWWTNHAFTPASNDPLNNAFRYVVTGETAYAQVAINTLMSWTCSNCTNPSSVASDEYRWSDWVPWVYDWCYNAMSASDRQTFMDRYNSYVDGMRVKSWGGPGLEGNNYYWGYFRNELSWGIATYYENPRASIYLDWALITRWQNSAIPYLNGNGVGGFPEEGSEYGPVMLSYPVVPLVTAELYGRSIFNETNYYKAAVIALIYDTTASPITSAGGYLNFSFSDSEYVPLASGLSGRTYLGDFIVTAANEWGSIPIGQYARQWINMVQPNVSKFVQSTDLGGTARPFTDLPLDYYSSGNAYLFTRNAWTPDATCIMYQMGHPSAIGHYHRDLGTIQIFRGDQQLLPEHMGYSDTFADGTTDMETRAHNSIVFNGKGQPGPYTSGGSQNVLRLESKPNYVYSAVDLSYAYRYPGHPELNNPYMVNVAREFIFIKPLETIFVLDRVKSNSTSVVQSTNWHMPGQPTAVGTDQRVYSNGNHALNIISLTPGHTFNVVNEGDGIYRLDDNVTGATDIYHIHVLQTRSTSTADATAQITSEDTNSWTITITVPSKGTAVVVMNKGMSTFGGSFGYAASGTPTLEPLTTTVQGFTVTNNGPLWDTGSTDTNPPVVSMTAPNDGATISGIITLAATASDDVGVIGVQFLVDGIAKGAEVTSSPYSISLDTSVISNGNHTLSALARDAAGNAATATGVIATIDNPVDTTPPVVAITSPNTGSTVSGNITLSATASDNAGVVGVQFLIDGIANGAEITSSPYSLTFNTLTLVNGNHTVTAKARDLAGNNTTSTGVAFAINNPDCPTATTGGGWINQAFTNQTGTFTATIDVTPSTAGMDGVVGLSNGTANAFSKFACLVVFATDNTIKARNGGSYPASTVPYSPGIQYHIRVVANVTNHTYSVYVTPPASSELTVATNYAFRTEQATVTNLNNWGAIVDIGTATLQVCNFAIGDGTDTIPPAVAITAPSNGSTLTGTVTVSATASDNVGVGGVQFLLDGNTLGTESTSSPYSTSLDTTTLSNGSHTLTARARDAASNTTLSSPVQVTVFNPSPTGNLRIIWRNYSTGENVQWNMNGTTYVDFNWLPQIADTQWKIRAVADLNADGKVDLVWRNASTGDNVVWLMNGATYVSSTSLPQIADTNWDIAGAADFNADSKSDLLWRNNSTGENVVWFMNGTTYSSSATLPQIADINWKIVGTGDINSDGKADILWRNQGSEADAGKNVAWFMNGSSYVDYTWLPQIADTDWQIGGTSDFNNDNKLDLLWRNYSTGQNVAWFMNGTTYLDYAWLPQIADTNWRIAGVTAQP